MRNINQELVYPTKKQNLKANYLTSSMFQSGESEIANACIRQTIYNENVFSNPLTILAFFVPGLGKVIKLFDPTLGINLEASDATANFMLEIMRVMFFFHYQQAERSLRYIL